MTRPFSRRIAPRPLDAAALDALALAYVGRFATSEQRLARYLQRKLFERGWDGGDAPDAADRAIRAAVERCAALGFVSDPEFARMRGASLSRRGMGVRALRAQLTVDGIAPETAAPVVAAAQDRRLATALAFARRRRFGPFGAGMPVDPKARDKILGAFLRAGHDAATARRIMAIAPGDGAALAELDDGGEAG